MNDSDRPYSAQCRSYSIPTLDEFDAGIWPDDSESDRQMEASAADAE